MLLCHLGNLWLVWLYPDITRVKERPQRGWGAYLLALDASYVTRFREQGGISLRHGEAGPGQAAAANVAGGKGINSKWSMRIVKNRACPSTAKNFHLSINLLLSDAIMLMSSKQN